MNPDPDSAEATTTAPTTADRPGTVTGGETSTTNTPNDLHHTFSPDGPETFDQKRARIDRSETISHVVHPTFRTPTTPETFAQRRSRIDRSETISYGPKAPGTPSRPQPYGPTTEHGFLVDILEPEAMDTAPETGLPSGWYADGYLVLEPIHDTWELKGNTLIRNHYVARDTLFNPRETGDCPIPEEMLAKDRTTRRGRHCHQDRWRNSPTPSTDQYWTGQTSFKILARHRREAQQAFYAASHGATTHAGAKEKRQKDARANLSERAMSLADRVAFVQAKKKELESFFTNHVWEFATEGEAPANRVLKAHFILKWSKHPDGSPRAKARLITQGFRDPDALAGLLDSTSPTLSRLGRTTLMSLASLKAWKTFIADITTAFLQGKEHPASRTLWIRLPADARALLGISDPRVLMRLRKPMYGLSDAPRAWYEEASRRLLSLGFTKHPLDGCLYLWFDTELRCAIGLHVDDLLGVVEPTWSSKMKEDLQGLFAFRDFREDQENFEFLGTQVSRQPDGGLSCGHEDYINKVKPIPLEKGRQADPDSPATDKEKTQLRALVGALQWAATQTSPHLQVHTSMLAGEVPRATVSTILAANKALRFAKANSDVKLLYPPILDNIEDIVFLAYSDAAFASRADMSSQGGYMVCLTHRAILDGGISSYHLLDWRSFRLPRVARPMLAAEGQAAAEAADCLHFVITFWKALLDPGYKINSDEQCFRWKNESLLVIDAKCLYDILHREELYVSSTADKRTCLEALVTRDKLKEIGGSVRWVSSERQYADGLTKDSATQLLADRLRTHQHKITADESYQASRKKDAGERARSANQFARPKAAASAIAATAFFATPSAATRTEDMTALILYHLTDEVAYYETGAYVFAFLLVTMVLIYLEGRRFGM